MDNKLVFEPTTLTQYHWNKFNIQTTYTYYWKLYTAIEEYLYTYYWDKYDVLPETAPTWEVFNAAEVMGTKYYWNMYNASQQAHKHYKVYKSYPIGDWEMSWKKATAKYNIMRDKRLPYYKVNYNVYDTVNSNTGTTLYEGEMCLCMKPGSQLASDGKNFYLYYTTAGTLSDCRISPVGIRSGVIPRLDTQGYKLTLYKRYGNRDGTKYNRLPYDIDTGLPLQDEYYKSTYPNGSITFDDNTSGFNLNDAEYMFYDRSGTAYTIIPNSYYNWDDGKMYNVVQLEIVSGDAFKRLLRDSDGLIQSSTYRSWSIGNFEGYCWMSPSQANKYGYTEANTLQRYFVANNSSNNLAVVGHMYYKSGSGQYIEYVRNYVCSGQGAANYLSIMPLNINTEKIYSNQLFNNTNLPVMNNLGINCSIEWCPECNLDRNIFITQKATTSYKNKTGGIIRTASFSVMDTGWMPNSFILNDEYYELLSADTKPTHYSSYGDTFMILSWDTERTTTTNKDLYPIYNELYVENNIPYYASRYAASEADYSTSDFTQEVITVNDSLKPTLTDYHQDGYYADEEGYIYIDGTLTLLNIDTFKHNNEFVGDEYCETNESLQTEDYIVDNTNYIYNYRVYIGVEHYWVQGSFTGNEVSSFNINDYPYNGAQNGYWYMRVRSQSEPTGEYKKGNTSYGTVYGKTTNQYPSNGYYNNRWYVYKGTTLLPLDERLQYLMDVSANSRNQYPDDGIHTDGYYYRYQTFDAVVIGYHRGTDTGEYVHSNDINAYPQDGCPDERLIWYSYDYSVPHYSKGNTLLDNVSSFIETAYPQNGYIINDYWYVYTSSSEIITGQLVIDNSLLMGGVNYTQEINPSEDLQIGTPGAAQVDFTIFAPDASAATQYLGKDFTYYVKMNSDADWRQIGTFTLTKAELPDKQTAKIQGFDYIYKFDTIIDEWLDEQTFPMTLGEMFASLCEYVGCEAYSTDFTNSDFQVNDNFEAVQITGRTILQYITEASGGFCVAEPDGRIHLKHYAIPPTGAVNLGNNSYRKYTHEIYNVPVISSVVVRKDDDDEGVESNV